MTVEEVNKVLKDKSMKSKETNFKIVQSGGKININKFYEEFIDFKNIVSEFIVEQRKFNAEQRKFNAEQRKFNANQEQFNKIVSNQFKKHGWTK